MTVEKTNFTVEEYLRIERQRGERHNYFNGKLEPMPGGSIAHNRISRNIIQHLGNALDEKEGYEIFGSDQKIYIPKYNYYLYPDAVVIAAAPVMAENAAFGITNPLLIIEVLSPSTGAYDRDEKFMLYRELESFKEYVLIRQDTPEIVSMYRSQPSQWEETEVNGQEESVWFKSIDIRIPLALIYRNVEL